VKDIDRIKGEKFRFSLSIHPVALYLTSTA